MKKIYMGMMAIAVLGLLLISGCTIPTSKPSSNHICCKVYGLGVGMKEVNINYEWRLPEDCVVPEGMTGGGRDIVADRYC